MYWQLELLICLHFPMASDPFKCYFSLFDVAARYFEEILLGNYIAKWKVKNKIIDGSVTAYQSQLNKTEGRRPSSGSRGGS